MSPKEGAAEGRSALRRPCLWLGGGAETTRGRAEWRWVRASPAITQGCPMWAATDVQQVASVPNKVGSKNGLVLAPAFRHEFRRVGLRCVRLPLCPKPGRGSVKRASMDCAVPVQSSAFVGRSCGVAWCGTVGVGRVPATPYHTNEA